MLANAKGMVQHKQEVIPLEEYPFTILDIANILRLTVRREVADSVYVDCPFCQKRKGKLNLNLVRNVWRCNRCGKSGHMFELYADLRNMTVSEAKLELIDLLAEGRTADIQGNGSKGCGSHRATKHVSSPTPVEQSPKASPEEIDKTMRALLGMLTLTPMHREHLRKVRGLSDEQILYLGLRSTPPYQLRHTIPQRLMDQGYIIAGVPGFFKDKHGKWTVNFTSWTAGILVPVRGLDGKLCGAQVRLDHPIKDDLSDPEDKGTKYIWFSSSTKNMGVSSGSPVNFIGDRYARTVYVTEGNLKAGISHCLSKRTFLSIQGAANLGGLEEAFRELSVTGTVQIVEALDMDKYNNIHVARGAQNILLLARKYGMKCLPLTWDPNYKGFDDWQLALKRRCEKDKEGHMRRFKEEYLCGQCEIAHLKECVQAWGSEEHLEDSLQDYLGLDQEDYVAFLAGEAALQIRLDSQRKTQRFRIYQLDLTDGKVIPFAFLGIKALSQSGYQQPPAELYRLTYDGNITVPVTQDAAAMLSQIFERFHGNLPNHYQGRSVAPSDVLELYSEQERKYYYRDDSDKFVPVRFSPALVKNRDTLHEQKDG